MLPLHHHWSLRIVTHLWYVIRVTSPCPSMQLVNSTLTCRVRIPVPVSAFAVAQRALFEIPSQDPLWINSKFDFKLSILWLLRVPTSISLGTISTKTIRQWLGPQVSGISGPSHLHKKMHIGCLIYEVASPALCAHREVNYKEKVVSEEKEKYCSTTGTNRYIAPSVFMYNNIFLYYNSQRNFLRGRSHSSRMN